MLDGVTEEVGVLDGVTEEVGVSDGVMEEVGVSEGVMEEVGVMRIQPATVSSRHTPTPSIRAPVSE